eukprot:TRINITY_DN29503_c0_g1_i1.p1 TRINITY_DN29503_c0_g1~~TRINITY_DN29503_c0_g1_i1.p1  ORF type:complete len:407 (-),score=137.43 TRINITY_DN29503_c0_g1_i1:759-1979(-)
MAVAAVKVTGTGSTPPREQQLNEFFSFPGTVLSLEVKPAGEAVEGEEAKWVVYVCFEDETATETALLLTGSLVEGHLVEVTKAEEDYEPPAVPAAAVETESTPPATSASDSAPSVASSATSAAAGSVAYAQQVIARLVAGGYTLGANAAARAKAFDEKHQLSKTAQKHAATIGTTAQAHATAIGTTARDLGAKTTAGAREKVTAGVDLVNLHVNAVDEKYSLTEKSNVVFGKAEEVVSSAIHATSDTAASTGRAILKGGTDVGKKIASTTAPVVASGHAWVKGAVENVSAAMASVTTRTGDKTAKGAEGEAEAIEKEAPFFEASESLGMKEKSVGATGSATMEEVASGVVEGGETAAGEAVSSEEKETEEGKKEKEEIAKEIAAKESVPEVVEKFYDSTEKVGEKK